MKKNDIVLYGLVGFFLIVSSIALHETVHIVQFTSSGSPIDEVAFLGWKASGDSVAAGWVKSTSTKNFSLGELEFWAHAVQFVYLIVAGFLLNLWALSYKGK